VALKVTQINSGIGAKRKTRGTLRALGLGRIGKKNILPDQPEIRGMIARVPHLIVVEEVNEGARKATKPAVRDFALGAGSILDLGSTGAVKPARRVSTFRPDSLAEDWDMVGTDLIIGSSEA